MDGTGMDLIGARILGPDLSEIIEDTGRASRPRVWGLGGSPATGGALILFAADTGRIASVYAIGDAALGVATRAGVAGGQLTLRGPFVAAWDARDRNRNLLESPVTEILVQAKTGRVLSAH
jgi:hypothetical protein